MKKYKIVHILNQYLPLVSGYTTRSKEIVHWTKPFSNSVIITKRIEPGWPKKERIDRAKVIRVFQYPIFIFRFFDSQIKKIGKIYRSPWGKKYHVDKWFRFLIFPIWLADVLRAKILQPAMDRLVFEKVLDSFKPDLIHAHTPFYMSLPMIKVARERRIPTIYEVRGVWEDTKVVEGVEEESGENYQAMKKLETETMKLADKVVVISKGLKKDILDRGIAKSKIALVPNCVDVARFKPCPKDKKLIKKFNLEGKTVLGYIGTIRKFEGLQLVIQALANIPNKKFTFLIVGYGEYESQLKKMVRELQIQDQVIFVGKVDPQLINQYYSIIDLCVYPRIKARVSEIVTPLKPLEAMAMEKFVLASDVGGLKEMVIPKISGDLFKADDVRDLVRKIKYYQNNNRRAKIAQSAKGWVNQNRNWEIVGRQYLEIYKKVCQ